MTGPALGILLTLTAVPSPAPEPEACRTVALHPVVVNGADAVADKAMIAEIQAVAASELLKRNRTLQDSTVVSDVLSKLPNKECPDNACLSRLARDTHSDCTAYFAVTPNAGRSVFLSARLIPASNADRPVFSRSEHYDRIGKTPKDWSISALQRFIRTVPLAHETAAVEPLPLIPKGDGQPTTSPNPPAPPPPAKPLPLAAAPAPPPPTTPVHGLDWRTPVGGGLAVAGIGAAVAGILFYRQGQADWQAVLDRAGGQPFPADQVDQILAEYRAAEGKTQLGSAGMFGGAAMAAAGAGLLLWELLGAPKDSHQGTKVACGFSASAVSCSLPLP